MREETPGDATFWIRVKTLLMFGDGVTSSSESLVSSALGVLSPGVWKVGFRREVRVCAGSFPVGGFGRHEHTGSSGSRIDATLEVVGAVSSIIHSGREDYCARDFPFSEVVSRSGVCRRIGVRDLSGVWDRSGVRRTGDWPRPDLSDPILFRLGWEERVRSGVFSILSGLEPSPSSAVIGRLCTTTTSPTASYRVPNRNPGGAL